MIKDKKNKVMTELQKQHRFLITNQLLAYMKERNESQLLITELSVRFEKKPRRCRKINDSGIGSSDRVVSVSNGRFYYYPKIQEFNDLDFDKLQYVVPKAGVLLTQILQLKFPPRRNNERNYFTIIIPKNKILKYTKSFKEMVIDETAQGEESWTFVFEYDIISLPEYERKKTINLLLEKQKLYEKKKKEQEENRKRQEQQKKKMEQEYESLAEAQKLLIEKNDGKDVNSKKKEEKEEKNVEKRIEEADDFYFQVLYEKILKAPSNEKELIELELDFLQVIGNFKMRSQKVVRNYIDTLPFNPNHGFDSSFIIDNFKIIVGFEKQINLEFLDNLYASHQIFNCRKKVHPKMNVKLRVPLMALVKYKGFKALVHAITPIDFMNKKGKDEKVLHGLCEQTWKTHFFHVDDLNLLLEGLNLRPYQCEVNFQRVSVHLGTKVQLIQSQKRPYDKMRSLITDPKFTNFNLESIIYIYDIMNMYPIDLVFEENQNQSTIRFRPEFVQNYQDNNEKMRLSGGALIFEYDDQEGTKDDLLVAKASQNLKYVILPNFVKKLDELKFVPLNSAHLKNIMKSNGINMRYLGIIFKLTSLPYLREMIKTQAIAREIKKLYRDHQKDYALSMFRSQNQSLIKQAYDRSSMESLKSMRIQQLKNKEKQVSIEHAIDFLNMVFGNTHETQQFWKIVTKKVKDYFKIEVEEGEYMNRSHGYLLHTVLQHCGFEIVLNSNLLLFMTPNPFSVKDWIKFTSTAVTYSFPSLDVYRKLAGSGEMTETQIVNVLELEIYLKRILGESDEDLLSQLSQYVPSIGPPKSKFSIQSLNYYINKPSKQNFEVAFEICAFIMPSSHPIFQDLYLNYSTIQSLDPITFKKAAQNHAIRTLGLSHEKTSGILGDFKQDQYLTHLIAAEVGVAKDERMELMKKIIREQFGLGRYIQCFNYTKKAIIIAQKQKLSPSQQKQYFLLLMIGTQVTYKLRKIEDMLKITQYFWNSIEKYRYSVECNDYIEHILYYSLKGFLESSKTKYYIFKLILILNEKFKQVKIKSKKQLLLELRSYCREAKSHINFIKEMFSKLTFGYTQISFYPDFFTNFDGHVRRLESEEFDQGINEISLMLKIYGIKYFEEALLDRSYTFDKQSTWDIPK